MRLMPMTSTSAVAYRRFGGFQICTRVKLICEDASSFGRDPPLVFPHTRLLTLSEVGMRHKVSHSACWWLFIILEEAVATDIVLEFIVLCWAGALSSDDLSRGPKMTPIIPLVMFTALYPSSSKHVAQSEISSPSSKKGSLLFVHREDQIGDIEEVVLV